MDKVNKVQKWANAIGMVSAAIALASLAITLENIRRDTEKARIIEWQEVAVFSIITDAGLDGLSFNDIQSQYKIKAGDLADELPRTEIQTQALRRVLLSLLAKRAISLRSDGKYGVPLESTSVQALRDLEKRREIIKLGQEVLQIVSEHPGLYTANQLEIMLKDKFTFSNQDFTLLLSDMQAEGNISFDSKGKISGLPRSNR
jgi:hypothetical protein